MTLLQANTKQTQAVLDQLSIRRRQRMRKHVQLMFLGMNESEIDPIVKLLRASRMSPRGHAVHTESQFLSAMSECSWDLILCIPDRSSFTVKQAMHHLRRLDKDIPIIQIVPEADSQQLLRGMRANLQAVVPMDEVELLTLYIRRELDHLEHRRRLRLTEAQLSDTEQRCVELMESSRDAIAFCSVEKVLLANSAFAALFGYDEPDELVGLDIVSCLKPEHRERLLAEHRNVLEQGLGARNAQLLALRKDDSPFQAELEMQEARYNNLPCVQLTVRVDREAEQAAMRSKLDLVSGLYSRKHLEKELDRIVQRALEGGADCSLLHIRLDQYEAIHSEHGVEGCDQIVRDVASVLNKHVNKAHLLARVADDAFVVVYRDPSPERALQLANKLCMAIAGNLSESGTTTLQTTCCIGVATISDNAPKRSELMARARQSAEDVLLKSPAGNGVSIYLSEDELPDEDNEHIARLRSAIEQQNLRLLYQPVVALRKEVKECYYEVLLRLLDDGREVSPSEFMDTLERADISILIDRWVMKESLRQLKREFHRRQRCHLFINLSGRTLKDGRTLTWFAELLRKSGLPAEHIIFQISELDAHAALRHCKTFTAALRKMHCRICIKHFGCSPNTELVLKQIAPELIKLDGHQIQSLANSSGEQEKQFYQQLHRLQLQERITIAPLVEGTSVMSKLWKAGVHFIQGNYLQPPKGCMDYDFFEH